MANEIPDIPPNMQKVYRRLRRWRSTHTGRLPIPESLWAAAGELAASMGLIPPRKLCTWCMASSSSERK